MRIPPNEVWRRSFNNVLVGLFPIELDPTAISLLKDKIAC
jgi:hypothetical protein